ncbi:MAG: hypothetical protein H6509_08050 [Bryobacterales bacterium]|nr:hypothetical protein [Bryobacterales bacterium]
MFLSNRELGSGLLAAVCLAHLLGCAPEPGPPPNLIPSAHGTSPNYWCTWYAQNYWIGRGEEITDLGRLSNENAREELNERTVFDPKEGWAVTLLPRSRGDYYFLIDHGWQIKDDSKREYGLPFFSLQIDPDDFPRYAGLSQPEALRKFNDDIRALGWRGLGIWVRGDVSEADAERFVGWSKQAGVEYWKIDGGDTTSFYCERAKQKLYPELTLEYVTGSKGPLNPDWDKPGLASYPSVYAGEFRERMLDVVSHSDTFRTYDATPLLVTSTTLQRTHDILRQTQGKPQYRALLNLQDDVNAAAALGCLAAVKRHPNYGERTYQGQDIHYQIRGKRMIQKRMDEAERFAIWQRIAPAFPAGEGSYLASETELIDSYPYAPGDTWMEASWGKTVYQSGPAVMARNMPLPEVEIEGDPPFVMASRFPDGAVAVATEGRVKPADGWYHPRARVTLEMTSPDGPIGVFGHYQTLVLRFGEALPAGARIWAQDLLADEATDVTSRVRMDGAVLEIPGELIDEVGTAAASAGDISAPGLVLSIRR